MGSDSAARARLVESVGLVPGAATVDLLLALALHDAEPPAVRAAAVAALEVDDAARSALLAADAGALGDLLGGRPKMICMLFPADDDQRKDGEEPAEQEPTDDEPKVSIRH